MAPCVFACCSRCRFGLVSCTEIPGCRNRSGQQKKTSYHHYAEKMSHGSRTGNEINSKSKDTAVHVMICSDGNTLGGMIALVNSIRLHTNASVMFHLVTDQASHDHLKTWIEKTELRGIKWEIILFDEEWVKGKYLVRSARHWLKSPVSRERWIGNTLIPNQ